MPRNTLEFRIVIASPSDVYSSRNIFFEVVKELNTTLCSQNAFIRGLGYEEYVTPGIDTDPQAVINSQLLKDYDILIALFGAKLGAPTPRAISGTVEEIEHAIANANSPFAKNRVQIYFKDRIDNVFEISPDDFSKLHEFRSTLSGRGILYSSFKDDDDLRRTLRLNIERSIVDYISRQRAAGHSLGPPSSSSPNGPPPTHTGDQGSDAPVVPPAIDDEELGLLDHQEKAERSIQQAHQSLLNMVKIIMDIANETDRRTRDIERLTGRDTPASEKKNVINSFASFLSTKATALSCETHGVGEGFDGFADSFIMLTTLLRESDRPENARPELNIFLDQSEELLKALPSGKESISTLRNVAASLPRVTIQFNRAKKKLLSALDEGLELFDQIERRVYQISAEI